MALPICLSSMADQVLSARRRSTSLSGLLGVLLGSLRGANVDQSAIAVGKPDEEIRYVVPVAPCCSWPEQRQQLRRNGDNVGCVIGRQQIIAFKERLEVDMTTIRARPIEAFIVPLARPGEELADGGRTLERDRPDVGR